MALRQIIEIDEELCDGCGLCIPSCAEGALAIVDGKAKLVRDIYCDGLGACLGECPLGALRVVEREAEDFDQKAVDAWLAESGQSPHAHAHAGETPAPSTEHPPLRSTLRQWPIQLSLVPPFAPYLQGADLLICADCVPFAYADFHRRFLDRHAVVIGCPKLDDLSFYVQKLGAIFQTAGVKSVTVAKMEVPCCGGIAQAARVALDQIGSNMPVRCVTIGIDGEIRTEETLAPGGMGSSAPMPGGCGGGCPSDR